MISANTQSLILEWKEYLNEKKMLLLVNNLESLSFLEEISFLHLVKSAQSLEHNTGIELSSLEDIYYLTIMYNGILKIITIHEGSWGKLASLGGDLEYDRHTGELYLSTKCTFDSEFSNEQLDNEVVTEVLFDDFNLAEKVINQFVKEN